MEGDITVEVGGFPGFLVGVVPRTVAADNVEVDVGFSGLLVEVVPCILLVSVVVGICPFSGLAGVVFLTS